MEVTHTRSAGGVVIGDHGTVAMVLSNNSNSWLLPKGHVEEGETDEEAARREIAEETGLTDLELLDDLGEFTRLPSDTFEEKTVKMFLFAAPPHALLAPTLEIKEARWVPYRELPETLGSPHIEWFQKDRAWFSTVFERVRQAIQRD
ncbi:MAG: hydrolase [Parcubacteria group bacterium]|nr:hydrolase [Parcubacteria group bacterium]